MSLAPDEKMPPWSVAPDDLPGTRHFLCSLVHFSLASAQVSEKNSSRSTDNKKFSFLEASQPVQFGPPFTFAEGEWRGRTVRG